MSKHLYIQNIHKYAKNTAISTKSKNFYIDIWIYNNVNNVLYKQQQN